MALRIGLSVFLLAHERWLGTKAELVTATCFPTLAQHSSVATSDLSQVPPFNNAPSHKVFCSGNQTGWWTYYDASANHRACLDCNSGLQTSCATSCEKTAPNHVGLTWLPGSPQMGGTGLSEYNISFEGKWTEFVPGMGTKRAAWLSLGLCFVINGGNGIDSGSAGPDWFGTNASGWNADSFNSFFIEVTTNYTKVNMDGKLVFQDSGVGSQNYLSNRDCQPLGHYTTGAMFGGFLMSNARGLFSRVEGQVRNLKLVAEVPDVTTGPPMTTAGMAAGGTNPIQTTAQASGTQGNQGHQGTTHRGQGTTQGGQGTTQGGQGAQGSIGTMPSNSASVTAIDGVFQMSIVNASDFLMDPQSQPAVRQGIATMTGVNVNKVEVNLYVVTRRLSDGMRRLLSASPVEADYKVKLDGAPSSGAGSASSVHSLLAGATISSLQSVLITAISSMSNSYSLTVTSKPTVRVLIPTPAPTPTPEASSASWSGFGWPLWSIVVLWSIAHCAA